MATSTNTHSGGWSRFALARPADLSIVAGTALTAWLFDASAQSGGIGLGLTSTLLAAGATLLLAGRPRNRWSYFLVVAASAMAPWITLRASPWLLWPDLAAGIGLLTCAAILAPGGTPFGLSFQQTRLGSARLLVGMAQAAAFIASPLASALHALTRGKQPTIAQVARGLTIAVPTAVVIGFLLASADPVFASFFNLNIDPGSVIAHAFWLAIGGWVAGGLMRTALSVPIDPKEGPRWRIDPVEALVVLLFLDALFVAFGIAQLVTAFGGGAAALRAANMTYADYARSGFFQLLAVAAISLPLLAGLSASSGPRSGRLRRGFTILVELAVLMTVLIIVVAHQRLRLYEAAYGFTMLRLYSHIFAAWIAIVFVMLGLALLRTQLVGPWFPAAAAAAGLTLLLTLNIVNPEAVVVRLNVAQTSSSHLLDRDYLAGLSDDAVPELVGSLPGLDTPQRRQLRQGLCGRPQGRGPGWAGFNLARQAATTAHASCS